METNCKTLNKHAGIFLLAGFFLVFHFIALSSQIQSEVIDVASILGMNGIEMSGTGIDVTKTENGGVIEFNKEDSVFVDKHGNEFKNIKPSGDSVIELNKYGDIVKAEFTTDENGGTYTLGGTTFSVPPNSKVFYDGKTGEIVLEEGGSIEQLPSAENKEEIVLRGKNITLPSGKTIEKGSLKYIPNEEKWSIPEKKSVTIDGIRVYSNSYAERDIYFDGEKHIGDYVSFYSDGSGIIIGSEEGISASGYGFDALEKVQFLDGNKIFSEGKRFSVVSLGEGSYIEIFSQEDGFPGLISRGEFAVRNGNKIISVGEEVKIMLTGKPDLPQEIVFYRPEGEDYVSYFKVNDDGTYTVFKESKDTGKSKSVSFLPKLLGKGLARMAYELLNKHNQRIGQIAEELENNL